MKMQRVSRRSVAVGGILAATLAVLAVEQARAFNPQPDPPGRFHFGMVGLARGQTARLNVVFVAPDIGDRGRDQASDPEWLVELSFVGSDGQTLGSPVQRSLRLGQSTFADLSFGDLAPDGGDVPPDSGDTAPDSPDRVQFRAVVRAQVPDGADRGKRRRSDPEWLPTLEVFDIETGRTQVVLAPGSTRFIKEVDPAPQSQR